MRSVRIWFSKTGTAKYISHLDLTRCLIRAFRRTDIPLWYTEGFNPHPHLVFGLSLPLGAEGLEETLDIRLENDDYENGKILEQLNKVTVPGISFLKISEPVYKPVEISFAEYEIHIPCRNADKEKITEFINGKIDSGSILIEKKTKKKEIKIINVCEHISDVSFDFSNENIVFNFTLPAGNDFTVNPVLFCNALFENSDIDPHSCLIKRLKLLIKDRTEYK